MHRGSHYNLLHMDWRAISSTFITVGDNRCSFCARSERQAGLLTIGPGDVRICYDCALRAVQATGTAKWPEDTSDHGLSSAPPNHEVSSAGSIEAEEILSLMLQRLAVGVDGVLETQDLWGRFRAGEAEARLKLFQAYSLVGVGLLTLVGDHRWNRFEKQSVVTEYNVALGSFLDNSVEAPSASDILDLVNQVVRKFEK